MNFEGILLGADAFLCIGIFHPLVIKAEYYFGVRSWWAFLIVGIAAAVGSLFVHITCVLILIFSIRMSRVDSKKAIFPAYITKNW